MSLTYTEADAKVRETALAAIPYPDETEAAWAEHAERERILSAYRGAATRTDATAARWEAYEYDLANPGTSSLLDELTGLNQPAAA